MESTVLALRSQVKSLQSEKDELSGENQSLLEQVNCYKVGQPSTFSRTSICWSRLTAIR